MPHIVEPDEIKNIVFNWQKVFLFTGSRQFETKLYKEICYQEVLEISEANHYNRLFADYAESEPRLNGIIVGDALGVDTEIAVLGDNQDIPIVFFGIKRNLLRLDNYYQEKYPYFLIDGSYPDRNQAMVSLASLHIAQECIAIWNGDSNGTKDTIHKALNAKINTRIIFA